MQETLGLMNFKGIDVEPIIESGVIKKHKDISYLLVE